MKDRTGYMTVSVPLEVKAALERLARDERRSACGQLLKLLEDGVIAAGYLKRERPEAHAA
jgi:hypothetical protein